MRLKNEVTVGLVVLAGLALLLFGAYWLSGKPWGQQQSDLVAVFRDAGQLSNGNPVKYRGVQVGRVTDIALAGGGDGVLVTMQIRPDMKMPPQPAVVLSPQSLFGDWEADIVTQSSQPDLQFTTTNSPHILPGATLPDITELTAVGARIAGDLETLSARVQLAFTEETALDIRRTVENVENISEQLNGFVQAQTQTYAGVSRNVLAATQNIQKATETVTGVAGTVQQQIPVIVANARTASQNLEELSNSLQSATQGVPAMVARMDTTTANFGRLAATADTVLRTVQPQVKELGPTLAEARAAMQTLQTVATQLQSGDGTMSRLMSDPALYEETQAAIASLRRFLADVQANPARYIGAFKLF